MTKADVALIKDVVRGDHRDAVHALKIKVNRELVYKVRIGDRNAPSAVPEILRFGPNDNRDFVVP
jgi:hypothetical protein